MIQPSRTGPEKADMGLLSECKAAIRQAAPDSDVILFGSRARGDAQEDSDYDLLVLVDCKPTMALEQAMVEQLFPLEMRSGKVLTFLVYQRSQWNSPLCKAMPLHKNVTREGLPI